MRDCVICPKRWTLNKLKHVVLYSELMMVLMLQRCHLELEGYMPIVRHPMRPDTERIVMRFESGSVLFDVAVYKIRGLTI